MSAPGSTRQPQLTEEEPTAVEIASLSPGRIQLCRVEGSCPIRFYAWLNPDARPGDPWLCAVHGISRDAREQVKLLRSAALANGYSIIAPLFDALRYPAYQRLGLDRGLRSDKALIAIAESLGRRFGAPRALDLFGFSGGAQFVHRFAMMEPERVRRLVVAAAGWFTLPDSERAFPYGIRPDREQASPTALLAGFSAIPQLVLVGAEDRARDSALRKRKHLDEDQGRTRLERSAHWHRVIRALAWRHGHEPDMHRFVVMPGVGHDFSEAVAVGALPEHLFRFLTTKENS